MAPPGLQAEEKEEIKATQLIQKISYLSHNLLPSVPEKTKCIVRTYVITLGYIQLYNHFNISESL